METRRLYRGGAETRRKTRRVDKNLGNFVCVPEVPVSLNTLFRKFTEVCKTARNTDPYW